jgi:glucose/arabinose dehydrogenase
MVTQRGGSVVLFARGFRSRRVVGRVRVAASGEGGLLGLTLDPGFSRNGVVYVYRTTTSGNEVVRYRFSSGRLRSGRVIVRGLVRADMHDGGRIKFGPDGSLYITTGEATQRQLAQDPASLNGKLLRLSGAAARGGGGRPEIVSSGHRNVQGIDWQPGSNRLVITELGEADRDEVNVIRQGGNYGWPLARGGDDGGGRFVPAAWDTGQDDIAPSGATFVHHPGSAWTGDFVFGALVGAQVRRLTFSGDRVTGDHRLFAGTYGRIRDVVEGPDGALYLLTSNRDGRGSPSASDDRIVRVVPPRA